MMDEITYEEVQAAIQKHLSVDDLVIAIVTEHASDLGARIGSDAPSPIDYGEIEMGPEVLAEDKEIERYPLLVPATNIRIVPVEDMFQSAGVPQ
jgi:zinc protease